MIHCENNKKKILKKMWNKMNSKLLICYCMPEKNNNKTNKQKNILEHELYGGRLPICMAEGGCIRVHNVSRIKVDIFSPSVCL